MHQRHASNEFYNICMFMWRNKKKILLLLSFIGLANPKNMFFPLTRPYLKENGRSVCDIFFCGVVGGGLASCGEK